jgi:transcriptional regulator with XRE-family HTH domain
LREKNNWSQPELGQRASKTQSVISRIEDPNYGKFTIRTLLDLASAYDVALFISFVPYTRLIAEIKDLSPKALAVASYEEERGAMEETARTAATSNVAAPSQYRFEGGLALAAAQARLEVLGQYGLGNLGDLHPASQKASSHARTARLSMGQHLMELGI